MYLSAKLHDRRLIQIEATALFEIAKTWHSSIKVNASIQVAETYCS